MPYHTVDTMDPWTERLGPTGLGQGWLDMFRSPQALQQAIQTGAQTYQAIRQAKAKPKPLAAPIQRLAPAPQPPPRPAPPPAAGMPKWLPFVLIGGVALIALPMIFRK